MAEEVETLVEQAAAGDADAWSALVGRFAGLVWSIARSYGLSGTDAADVSQTTWLRFAEHLERLHDPGRAGSWLATTARREAIRVGKLGVREVLVDPWDELETRVPEDEVDAGLLERERDLAVQEAFASMPARCRRLLTALLQEPPRPYAELSVLLDMPVGSIGPSRARCLDRLRALIAEAETKPTPTVTGRRQS